jgi:hypothetical protein
LFLAKTTDGIVDYGIQSAVGTKNIYLAIITNYQKQNEPQQQQGFTSSIENILHGVSCRYCTPPV